LFNTDSKRYTSSGARKRMKSKRPYQTPKELAAFREPLNIDKSSTSIRIRTNVLETARSYQSKNKNLNVGRIIEQALLMYCARYPADTLD
jgi:hypothetical protein